MADYLTRLVERTLGLSPVVRPDIPPAFAPRTSELSHPDPSGHLPQRREHALHHQPPKGLEVGSIASAHDEEGSPGEQQGETPPSTSGDPADLIATPSARSVRPLEMNSVGEGVEVEHSPTGSGEEVEHPREPKEHQRRPSPTAAPSEPPETSGEDGDRTGEHLTSRSDALRPPAQRPPTSRGMVDDPGRHANEATTAPSSTRAHAAPPPNAGGLDISVISAQERPVTPGPLVSPEARLEEPERPHEPLVPGEAGTRGRYERPTVEVERVSPQGPAPGLSLASRLRETAGETQPPTVRITIGRVEVRAVPPEPVNTQPPAEARSESALSLEDYLKQPGGVRR